jgi:TolB-like protein
MTELLKKGWIRIRHNPRYDQWTIQIFASCEKVNKNIRNWIARGVSEGFINKLSDYKLLLIKDKHISEGKITEFYSEIIDK